MSDEPKSEVVMALSDRHCAFLVAAILTPMFWPEDERQELESDDVLDLWETLAGRIGQKIALMRAEDLVRT